jgi:hypothetical protein
MLSLIRWFSAALHGRHYGTSDRASVAESEAIAAAFLVHRLDSDSRRGFNRWEPSDEIMAAIGEAIFGKLI